MTKLSNFITRRWTTKKGVAKECYYHRGSLAEGRKLTALGPDYSSAIKKYADIIGIELLPAENTVKGIYLGYIAWAEKRNLSKLSIRVIRDRKYYWKFLEPVFGDCDINTLESSWMFEYFELRSSQVSAKKELKFFSVMCNWAKARGKMQAPNPFTGIMVQMKVKEGREIYVEDGWYQLVFKNGTQMIKDVMEFTYEFANRPAETQASMFSEIDGDELVVKLPKTKGKGLKEKRVPVNGNRLVFINKQKAKMPRSFYIVSDEKGQRVRVNAKKFQKQWKEARDNAEIEAKERELPFTRFQLRDLRAKAATDIAREYGIEAARLMLGHTTQKQTAAYIRSVKGAAKMAFAKELGK